MSNQRRGEQTVSIVRLGCDIAELHHRYAAIHGALFGAASYRLVIASMKGHSAKTYRGHIQTLQQVQTQLSELAAEVPTADGGVAAHQAEQLRPILSEYVVTLDTAITELLGMCNQLLQDEKAYRDSSGEGKSAFNQDKVRYDRVLLQLDQLGRRLNQLFSRF